MDRARLYILACRHTLVSPLLVYGHHGLTVVFCLLWTWFMSCWRESPACSLVSSGTWEPVRQTGKPFLLLGQKEEEEHETEPADLRTFLKDKRQTVSVAWWELYLGKEGTLYLVPVCPCSSLPP